MSADWLLTHGWHRDSDDPDTWRRNKDQLVPANTEGPGLSFDEAVQEARDDIPGGVDRGDPTRYCSDAAPPLAVSAEARAIQEAVGYILDLALNYRPAYGCKSAQERLLLAKNAATSLDALLAQVAEAERERERLRSVVREVKAQIDGWFDATGEDFAVVEPRGVPEMRVFAAKEIIDAALRGGDAG